MLKCHFALLMALLAGSATAQLITTHPAQAKHAKIELLTEKDGLRPGVETNFPLGVHFVLEKGWHIYWVNPGDSGQPPVFAWELPPGFNANGILWPRPERMQSSSQLADYGYHDDVLLLVPMHVSRNASSSAPAQITLNAKWLICREVCLPDRVQLHLTLPFAANAGDHNLAPATLFGNVLKLLPRRLPSNWSSNAESRQDDFVLRIHADKPIAKAEFFPLDPGQVENAAPQKPVPLSHGVEITLKKSEMLLKPIAVLRGVVVLPGGDSYQIEVPVTSPKAIK